MFCPWCGSPTERRGGETVCPAGNMPFAPRTAARLSAAFVERTATPSAEPLRFRAGGRWYCPGCGIRMISEPHDVRCPRCALHLNEFLVELVELHSHGGTIDPLTGEHVYDRNQAE
jgi:uncharacterized Zn finger protein (UPF0148 family)